MAAIEHCPEVLHDSRMISLRDVVIFELLLEIDALDSHLGYDWKPLCSDMKTEPVDLFADVAVTELDEVFRLWQDAFEWSYYDGVLAGLKSARHSADAVHTKKSFQALFCIDERECSLRRYAEMLDPECETFGISYVRHRSLLSTW